MSSPRALQLAASGWRFRAPRPGRWWLGWAAVTAALPAWSQTVSSPAVGVSPAAEAVSMAAFVVNADPFMLDDPVAPSSVSVTLTDLSSRPQAANDLFRALTALPGVTADDLSAKFWVRGAPNSQVLARLDGMELIEPYHLKDIDGALSIIDLNTIDRVDLSTGGFTAEHGQRLAGVLTMETPSGSELKSQTALDASLLSFRAANSGTVQDGRGRWLASVRRGYPELALGLQGRSDELSPEYYDVTAKFEYEIAPRQVLSLHALSSADTLEARVPDSPPLSSTYGSDYLWARWRGAAGERLRGEAMAFAQRHSWRRNADGLFAAVRGIHLRDERRFESVGARSDWTFDLHERALLRAGAEARTSWADYRYTFWQDRLTEARVTGLAERSGVNRAREPWGASMAAYAAPRLELRPWLIAEPSIRFDHVSYSGDSDWSPRLNLVANRNGSTWRAAWGRYNQPQGLHELAVGDGEQTFHRSEQAEHRVLGWERRVRDGLSLRVEAYERRSWQLRPYWENPVNSQALFPELLSDRVRLDPSVGRARGVETRLQGQVSSRIRWSAAYALARAGEKVAGTWIPSPRDQRHTFQAHVTFTPNDRWLFSAAWQGHTGWPVTDFEYVPSAKGWVRVTGPLFDERLPAYHRLDLRAARTFRRAWGQVQVFVDVFNAYDRENLLGYEPRVRPDDSGAIVKAPVKLFPVLPNIGLSCRF